MSRIPRAPRHPLWCDQRHGAAWPVHSRQICDIETGEKSGITVELAHYRDRPEAVVSLTIGDEDNDTVTELTAAQALELGQRLIEAHGRLSVTTVIA